MTNNRNKTIFEGAAVLIIANLVVKAIGVIYKVPLTNLMGASGMGYFSAAFEIHQLLLTFALSLPVVVSKMISESYALGKYKEVKKILYLVLVSFTFIGVIGSFIMYFGADLFSWAIGAPEASFSMKILAPSVLLFAIASIFRGYFQGFQNMYPTAITQVIEAITKLLIGVSIASFLVSYGYADYIVSAGAISGVSIGTLLSVIILSLTYAFSKTRKKVASLPNIGEVRTSKVILKTIVFLVIPITLGSVVINLTGVLDLFLIMGRLASIGATGDAPITAYGAYKSYAQILFNLPVSIVASLNLSIIPAIAAAFVTQRKTRVSNITGSTLRITILFSLASSVGLVVLASPILHLIFASRPQEVEYAVPLLQVLSISIIWATIASFATSVLQAIGKVRIPVISLAIGGIVKLASNYILVGTEGIGIYGAPIGTNLCYITIMCINLFYMFKYIKIDFRLSSMIIKPIISSAIMGIIGYYSYIFFVQFMGHRIATIPTLIVAVISYGIALLSIKCITKDDLENIPGGAKIAKAFHKILK